MYTLILTHDERKAIDWIGNRYSHGDELFTSLCFIINDSDNWDSDGDITFTIPEFCAWDINEIIKENNYALECFSDELKAKLIHFSEQII